MTNTLLKNIKALPAMLVLTACAANPTVETAEPEKTLSATKTLYNNVHIIDGTGAPLQRDMAILVADGKIAHIGPADAISSEEETTLVDGKGMYVLPGLIDSHVHMATLPNDKFAHAIMRRQIYSGVTSTRDMAGDGRALADLARRSRLQQIPAPDLYYAALMAGPSFFTDPRPGMSAQGEQPGAVPWMQAIDDETDIAQAVTLAKGSWASGIKVYANLSAEQVRAIAAEAHKQDMLIWSHSMVFPAFPHEVAEAGADTMSHVCRFTFEISKEKPTEYHHKVVPDYANLDAAHPKLVAIFKGMAKRGTNLDATLWLYEELERMRQESAEANKIPVKCPVDFAAKLTQVAFDNGVNISTGTDSNTPHDDPFPGLYRELEALAAYTNMPTTQIIRSATLVGAKVLGLQKEIGTVTEGKRANLMFVRENPLQNIANLRSVELTLTGGQQYWRRDFKALSADELGE
jgi:imidazolonepropionase-like amidohydrolase